MIQLAPGIKLYRGHFDASGQNTLVEAVRQAIKIAPLFQPVMPGNGKAFSVKMSNFGAMGWVSDRGGYRYQKQHPVTGHSWPDIPQQMIELWQDVTDFPLLPEACLINFYDTTAKMGLHQDRDEENLAAPVVSISLGDSALFRFGSNERKGKTASIKLHSGDVLVMRDEARLCFHGIDRIYAHSSKLLLNGGRLNLTLRRINF